MSKAMNVQPEFIKLLAPEIRWQIIQLLKAGDQRVQELVERLDQPKNLLSYHLKQLREHALVSYRRSDADRRDYYYSLNIPRLQALYQQTGEELHLAPPDPSEVFAGIQHYRWTPPVRVLFLCTHNSARSQMAEGLMRHLAGTNAEVYSAGSVPGGVHPYAVEVMAELGIDIRQQQSQHFDAFLNQSFDYVITVCDNVREVCPTFSNNVETIHWSFSDPLAAPGDEQLQVFRQTAESLAERIQYLMLLIQNEREE
jgi:ArsR family transcriptional regulator, arsenate/arsenite/antimonite-responsive transcriptional repressor / arsenate reductase (thioredoxin)